MSSRPSQFPTTNALLHDGKARIYRLSEMLSWPPPEWLVESWIPKGAMSGLYGPPGSGKSMLAMDWALSVAYGCPWLDHAVEQGYALYIAAEGHSGQAKRARAWLQHRGLTPSALRHFGFVKDRIAIADVSEDYEALFSRIEEELQKTPTFVVIDTLARSIEGDENESLAMGQFLRGAERWTEEYGATVLVIHHGNASGTRERGHTSFKGAVGALLRLTPVPKHADLLCLHTDKQRDAAEAPDLGLAQSPVEGTDSIVLVRADLPAAQTVGSGMPAPLRKADMVTLLGVAEEGLSWREWRLACGLDKDRFNRRVRQLTADSAIYKSSENGRYYVYPANADVAEDQEEG